MKHFKSLTLITAFLLLLTTPLVAQTQDDPTLGAGAEAELQVGDDALEADAEARLTVADDGDVDGDLEADVDVEDDGDVDAEVATTGFDDDYDDGRLPQTASPLALIALLGTAGAGTALGLRRLRK